MVLVGLVTQFSINTASSPSSGRSDSSGVLSVIVVIDQFGELF